jgi:hypothetical protein
MTQIIILLARFRLVAFQCADPPRSHDLPAISDVAEIGPFIRHILSYREIIATSYQDEYVQGEKPTLFPCLRPRYSHDMQSSTREHKDHKDHKDHKKHKEKREKKYVNEDAECDALPLSFLFVVNEFTINEDVDQGGWPPEGDRYGNTIPPHFTRGYGKESVGKVWRYYDGQIELAPGYWWYRPEPHQDGGICPVGGTEPMAEHGIYSVFNCWRLLPCIWTDVDVSVVSMANTDQTMFHALHFQHDKQVTRILHGRYRWAAGRGADWIPDLIPKQYGPVEEDAPPSAGLGGYFGVIIALMALAMAPDGTDRVFRDRLWHNNRWARGSRERGASQSPFISTPRLSSICEANTCVDPHPLHPPRGVLVQICYDEIENFHGSNRDSLEAFETTGVAIKDSKK